MTRSHHTDTSDRTNAMNVDLKNRVALVTGGARDIGRAISRALAASGAAVAVNYNASREQADSLVAEITGLGGRAIAVQADVTKGAEVERLVAETAAAFGGLDILVNNAGGLVARKKMDEMDEAFWDQVMALNLKSVFLATKAALPSRVAAITAQPAPAARFSPDGTRSRRLGVSQ